MFTDRARNSDKNPYESSEAEMFQLCRKDFFINAGGFNRSVSNIYL